MNLYHFHRRKNFILCGFFFLYCFSLLTFFSTFISSHQLSSPTCPRPQSVFSSRKNCDEKVVENSNKIVSTEKSISRINTIQHNNTITLSTINSTSITKLHQKHQPSPISAPTLQNDTTKHNVNISDSSITKTTNRTGSLITDPNTNNTDSKTVQQTTINQLESTDESETLLKTQEPLLELQATTDSRTNEQSISNQIQQLDITDQSTNTNCSNNNHTHLISNNTAEVAETVNVTEVIVHATISNETVSNATSIQLVNASEDDQQLKTTQLINGTKGTLNATIAEDSTTNVTEPISDQLLNTTESTNATEVILNATINANVTTSNATETNATAFAKPNATEPMRLDAYKEKMLKEIEDRKKEKKIEAEKHSKLQETPVVDVSTATTPSIPTVRVVSPPETDLADRFNYAAFDAGAKMISSSDEMKKASSLLVNDDDRYMMVPCANDKYFVIQLKEEILIDTIAFANLEHYSSGVKEFELLGAATHPTTEWFSLGRFSAVDKNAQQVFPVITSEWVRFVKFRWLSHFGEEYYCTMTYIRVYGRTALEDLRDELIQANSDRDEVRQSILKTTKQNQQQPQQQNQTAEDASSTTTTTSSIETQTVDANNPPTDTSSDLTTALVVPNATNPINSPTSDSNSTSTNASTTAEPAQLLRKVLEPIIVKPVGVIADMINKFTKRNQTNGQEQAKQNQTEPLALPSPDDVDTTTPEVSDTKPVVEQPSETATITADSATSSPVIEPVQVKDTAIGSETTTQAEPAQPPIIITPVIEEPTKISSESETTTSTIEEKKPKSSQSVFKALTNRIKELEIHQELATHYVSDLSDRFNTEIAALKATITKLETDLKEQVKSYETQIHQSVQQADQAHAQLGNNNQQFLTKMEERFKEMTEFVSLVEGIIQIQLVLLFTTIVVWVLWACRHPIWICVKFSFKCLGFVVCCGRSRKRSSILSPRRNRYNIDSGSGFSISSPSLLQSTSTTPTFVYPPHSDDENNQQTSADESTDTEKKSKKKAKGHRIMSSDDLSVVNYQRLYVQPDHTNFASARQASHRSRSMANLPANLLYSLSTHPRNAVDVSETESEAEMERKMIEHQQKLKEARAAIIAKANGSPKNNHHPPHHHHHNKRGKSEVHIENKSASPARRHSLNAKQVSYSADTVDLSEKENYTGELKTGSTAQIRPSSSHGSLTHHLSVLQQQRHASHHRHVSALTASLSSSPSVPKDNSAKKNKQHATVPASSHSLPTPIKRVTIADDDSYRVDREREEHKEQTILESPLTTEFPSEFPSHSLSSPDSPATPPLPLQRHRSTGSLSLFSPANLSATFQSLMGRKKRNSTSKQIDKEKEQDSKQE